MMLSAKANISARTNCNVDDKTAYVSKEGRPGRDKISTFNIKSAVITVHKAEIKLR